MQTPENGITELLHRWGWELFSGLLFLVVIPVLRWAANTTFSRIKRIEDALPNLATKEEVRSLIKHDEESYARLEKKMDSIMDYLLRGKS